MISATARWCALATCLALAAGCGSDFMLYGGNAKVKKAEERVRSMLEGMKADGGGTGADSQTALCRWWDGSAFLADRDELETAELGFIAWLREKNLYRKQVASYEIVDSELIERVSPVTVRMTITIDGTGHTIFVPEGRPIIWGKEGGGDYLR